MACISAVAFSEPSGAGVGAATLVPRRLNHLKALEAESIHILREAAAEFALSLAKTRAVLCFTPSTMLQASAQAVDFKVGRHFGEGQVNLAGVQTVKPPVSMLCGERVVVFGLRAKGKG